MLGQFNQVDRVFLERLEGCFGVWVVDVLDAGRFAQGLDCPEQSFLVEPIDGENFLRFGFHLGKGEQEMLSGGVRVVELLGLFFSFGQDPDGGGAGLRLGGLAGDSRQSLQFGLGDLSHAVGVYAGLADDRMGDRGAVFQERRQNVQRHQLSVTSREGLRLGISQGLLGQGCKAIHAHRIFLRCGSRETVRLRTYH